MSKKKTGTETSNRMSNEPEEMVSESGPSLPVIELALDKIRVDETKNLRRFSPDAKSVEELAESIKLRGLLQPVVVRALRQEDVNGSGETHELKAGYRRMQALRLNGAETVLATVLPSGVDGVILSGTIEDKLINLSENKDRKELSIMDQAHAAKELEDAGMRRGDIAKAFGMSAAWATKILKFLELRPHVQKLIHEGKVPFRSAAVMAGMSEVEQDKLLADIAESEKEGPSATEQVDKANKKNRKKKAKAKVKAKAQKIAKKLVAKTVAADPRIKAGERFGALIKATKTAHEALGSRVKKAGKKASAKDKSMVQLLGAVRMYLTGASFSTFKVAVGKLL